MNITKRNRHHVVPASKRLCRRGEERNGEIGCKYAFSMCLQMIGIFDKGIQYMDDVSSHQMKSLVANKEIWEHSAKELRNKTNYEAIANLHAFLNPLGISVFHCDPSDIMLYLKELCMNGKYQVSTLQKKISTLRCSLKLIGRVHHFDDGFEIAHDGMLFKLHTGNPLATNVQELIAEFNSQPVPKTLPVPAPMLLQDVVAHLRRALVLKDDDVQRIHHCHLALLKSFMLHGNVAASVIYKLKHSGLNLILHTKVPMLTLVFLKNSTLSHILRQTNQHCYSVEYEGTVIWAKPTLPTQYNVLDAVFVYIICMRICLGIASKSSHPPINYVFEGRSTNLSELVDKHRFHGQGVQLLSGVRSAMQNDMADRSLHEMMICASRFKEAQRINDKWLEATFKQDNKQDKEMQLDFLGTVELVTALLRDECEDVRKTLLSKMEKQFDGIPMGANIHLPNEHLIQNPNIQAIAHMFVTVKHDEAHLTLNKYTDNYVA
jgi:hypothetical protein